MGDGRVALARASASRSAWRLAVFAVFAGLFALGLMGGGDVKLLGALALWLPWQAMSTLLVIMALVGGVITLVTVIHHRMMPAGSASRRFPMASPSRSPACGCLVNAILILLHNNYLCCAGPATAPLSGGEFRHGT